MKVHYMRLKPEPFAKIGEGSKTIELRLYDEKRRQISEGDRIVFKNTENDALRLEVSVKKVHIFDSFAELYKNFDKVSMGYEKWETAEPSDMEKYYSKDDIKKYGVVGIEIALHGSRAKY